VGSGGSEGGTGGRGAGADSVGGTGRVGGRLPSDRFPVSPDRRRCRSLDSRSAATTGAAAAAGGSALGVGTGETITGPVGGRAMNGMALSDTPESPASVGVPAPIATSIGREAMVASMITTTASRPTGPDSPGPR
jgi:hypothetical protein